MVARGDNNADSGLRLQVVGVMGKGTLIDQQD